MSKCTITKLRQHLLKIHSSSSSCRGERAVGDAEANMVAFQSQLENLGLGGETARFHLGIQLACWFFVTGSLFIVSNSTGKIKEIREWRGKGVTRPQDVQTEGIHSLCFSSRVCLFPGLKSITISEVHALSPKTH